MGAEKAMNPTSFVIVAALLSSTTATAQSIEFVLDSSSSSVTTGLEFAVPLAGTLIGDYDAKSNPGGTQTRPGLFGGSGNNPIDCDLTIAVVGDPTPTAPAGEIVVDLSGLEASQMVVESFRLDLLDGSTTSIGGELRFLYETFNTINPFSIYPGGIEIPIPLTDASLLRSELVAAGASALFAGEVDGEIVFEGVLPVTWSIEFDAGTGTQSQEIPAAIPFAGTISGATGDRTLQFGGSTSNAGSEPLDIPVGPIPVPLPTIPPGGTANLLFSGAITSVDFSFDFAIDALARETDSGIFGDLDGDGRVDAADIGLVIAFWGPCPGCDADLTGDGIVDSSDLGLVIAAWTS